MKLNFKITDYKKKYNDALERARDLMSNQKSSDLDKHLIEKIFPELKDDDDDDNSCIKKVLIDYFQKYKEQEDCGIKTFYGIPTDDILAWLEKRGEQKPNYCHHEVDLSGCSEEYKKAYYDGWNNCNMQHSQCKSELDDVLKCLINGMKFYYEDNKDATWGTYKWSMPVKHIIEVLEKQGEQPTDKVETKFKVGDWITDGYVHCKITEILDDRYIIESKYNKRSAILFENKNRYHLWTINDAQDGDVLVDSYSKDSIIILYKGIYKERSILAHCGWNGYNFSIKTNGFGYGGLDNTDYLPATKEQRDLLFEKMKNTGYEWDAENKELKRLS